MINAQKCACMVSCKTAVKTSPDLTEKLKMTSFVRRFVVVINVVPDSKWLVKLFQ
jgi:hypothetical protein